MCGIIGIVGTTEVASALYDGLTVLQHRGQDAAGIATVDGARLRLHKDNGLVRDVFNQSAMNRLRGTYDALNTTPPLASPPDILVDAMQTGDRMGYHPEDAQKEIAHFRQVLPEAQAAVNRLVQEGTKHLDEFGQRMHREAGNNIDMHAETQKRVDAFARAEKLIADTAK